MVKTTFLPADEARRLSIAKAESDGGGVAVFRRSDLPTLPNECVFEVAYAEEYIFGAGGKMLELTHSGLIFTRKGYHGAAPEVITLQYFGVSFGSDVILPHIDNEAGTLEWRNDSMIACSLCAFGSDRWNLGTKKVGTVTGKAFNEFSEWVPQFLYANPGYQMWDVWSHPKRSSAQRWVDGCKCDEFCEQAFFELHRLGGNFSYSPRNLLYKNYIPFLSAEEPTAVDMSDADEAMAVFTHYTKLAKLSETLASSSADGDGVSLPMMLRTLAASLETWYVYDRGQNRYLKVILSPPFICLHKLYQPMVLPWQDEQMARGAAEAATPTIGEYDALTMLTGMGSVAMKTLKERAPDVIISPAKRRVFVLAALCAAAFLGVVVPIVLYRSATEERAVLYFYAGLLTGMLELPLVLVAVGLCRLGRARIHAVSDNETHAARAR